MADKMNHSNIKKILIFALCGIGDIIVLTPTITSIKKNYPESEITVVIRKNVSRELLENNPFVYKIFNYPDNFIINVWTKWFKSKDKIKDIKNLIREIKFLLRLRKEKYYVSLWAFPGEMKRGAIVNFLAGAKLKMGPSYKIFGIETGLFYDYSLKPNNSTHRIEDNLQYVSLLDADNQIESELYLKISKKDEKFAQKFLINNNVTKNSLLIGLHPGCDKFNMEKRWPIENFMELVRRLLAKKNLKVVVFEGPDEEKILNSFKKQRIIKAKNLSIMQVAGVIKECGTLITSDSGLGHVAAALNVPTITLCGPANPNKTRPFGNKGIVISKLDPKFYLDEDKKRFLKEEGHRALERIAVNDVLKALEKILKYSE